MTTSPKSGPEPPLVIRAGAVIQAHSHTRGAQILAGGNVQERMLKSLPALKVDLSDYCSMVTAQVPDSGCGIGGLESCAEGNSWATAINARSTWREVCERQCARAQDSPDTNDNCPEAANCGSGYLGQQLAAWTDPLYGRKLSDDHVDRLSAQYEEVCSGCVIDSSGKFYWDFRSLNDWPLTDKWEPGINYSPGSLVYMHPLGCEPEREATWNAGGCNPPYDRKYYIADCEGPVSGRVVLGSRQNVLVETSTNFGPAFGHNPTWYAAGGAPTHNISGITPGYLWWDNSASCDSGVDAECNACQERGYITGTDSSFAFVYATGRYVINCPVGINTGACDDSLIIRCRYEIDECGHGLWQGDCSDWDCYSPWEPPDAHWEAIENPYWTEVSEEWIMDAYNKASKWQIRGCCESVNEYGQTGRLCFSDQSTVSILYLYKTDPPE